MAFYMFLAERQGSGVGSRWAFMGLAVKLGVSVSPVLSDHSDTPPVANRFGTDGSS
jgi:hypothetical protein